MAVTKSQHEFRQLIETPIYVPPKMLSGTMVLAKTMKDTAFIESQRSNNGTLPLKLEVRRLRTLMYGAAAANYAGIPDTAYYSIVRAVDTAARKDQRLLKPLGTIATELGLQPEYDRALRALMVFNVIRDK